MSVFISVGKENAREKRYRQNEDEKRERLARKGIDIDSRDYWEKKNREFVISDDMYMNLCHSVDIEDDYTQMIIDDYEKFHDRKERD